MTWPWAVVICVLSLEWVTLLAANVWLRSRVEVAQVIAAAHGFEDPED